MSGGLKNKKKKGHEWDLNDWRWDGNLFLATPSPNADAPSGCGSRELGRAEEGCSFGAAADKSRRRRRRRVTTVDNPEECSNTAIHNERNAVWRGQIGEEEGPASATAGASSSSAPSCQVDGCHADLSDDRDYHRRHKVCEPHTKSTLVRIKNIEHRFCQQCSRFHLVQEFDEGKKSCRSRLATHNRRRRKAPAEAVNSLGENQSLTNTLLLLLRQLAGQDSASSSEQINGPNLLVSLLKNLAAVAGTQACQDMLKDATSSNAGNYVGNQSGPPVPAEEPPVKRRAQNFDLNDAYVEEDESRTDKIVFKLFGKQPNDFPADLRAQILNWLSHYPSDMESYIRPGCVILTIYLRLPNWMWDKINVDPAPWIENLISISTHGFWETGWLYARVQDRLTLSCNGRLMLVSPWRPVIGDKHQILCVTPIAAAYNSTANFSVRGFNIAQPTTKLLCIFGGKYLVQEATQKLHADTRIQQGPQCLTFSCSFPSTSGRGFIEVEDYDQSSICFPFVVAEESICCEIRMLEEKLNIIAFGDALEGREDLMASRSQALKFLHEIGWLLQRSHTRATSSKAPQQHHAVGFSAARFRWLLSFAVDQEWCGVVKMLLDTLFQGNIDVASPVDFVLGESLVFAAVNKRSKPLVACLLRYTTKSAPVGSGAVATPARFLFTPDMTGSSDITPLHVAATITNAAAVLDALTDDPQQLGIKTWKNARDATGYTPEDYARRRGHTSYIKMVENKINSRLPAAHVSVAMTTTGIAEKHTDDGRPRSTEQTVFDVEKSPPGCRQCVQLQHIAYRPCPNRFLSNRPAVLSLVAIAAVCVCVGLIMQSPPVIRGLPGPFLWNHIRWGPT
ncbi:squamosa promoter-binding-like protein 1 isoform X2 [Aegilops tauschii subsp. strangulata]|uniref:SBP-type domain-containing protein n=3 Tax=Aegilops tauschii subsp. strangulata TaxID=200361 RepID=A0A453RAP7_AEGTS|nr:squamosa promoter-binding-like protein 1 isoform X1 [Aegilops tauschii subsp. strangulata]